MNATITKYTLVEMPNQNHNELRHIHQEGIVWFKN